MGGGRRVLTKAETLRFIRPKVRCAIVLDQIDFTVRRWAVASPEILSEMAGRWEARRIIVRSSARTEDGLVGSNAGRFLSVLDVRRDDGPAVRDAIERVIKSYDTPDGEHQVLVQPQLEDIAMSGVVVTRDLDALAPYYVFNFDESSRRTDTVTSGTVDGLRTFVWSRFAPGRIADARLAKVHAAVREVEAILGSDRLDVEFALSEAGDVYIFQARPIAVGHETPSTLEAEVEAQLRQINVKLAELGGPHPSLHGRRSVFGIMPDWNPAEMIGVRPRRLACSLYKELITDSIWAYQRDNYGYRNLRSFPLMVTFGGCPYIDVRVSFNSFIPADVQDDIASRLADYYVERLVAMPGSHDKVEFDVVFSCFTLDLDARLSALLEHGFSVWELGDFRSSLRHLTNRVISPLSGLYTTDLHKVRVLERRRVAILDSDLSAIGKIYWLLEDCKRYGTLPFAGLARAAFIGVQVLRSMVAVGILSQEEHDRFLRSLNTVTRALSRDVARMRTGDLSRDDFLSRYGHLRPGTYDIRSPRYDEEPDRYFGIDGGAQEPPPVEPFVLSDGQVAALDRELARQGLVTDAHQLLRFIREAIEGREWSKFVFSRNVSDAMRLITRFGRDLGFDVEDLSHVDVRRFLELYASTSIPDVRSALLADVEAGRRMYEITRLIKLPALICSLDDIYGFLVEEGTPNYVTLGRVAGPVVAGPDVRQGACEGKIVMIESADPGYDWIFSAGLAGLITKYGGTNSHMAIRAAELGIPAVIGCGEKLYGAWSGARLLEIDAASRQVRYLG